MLSARRIKDVVKKIAAIAHVKIIRVHTRVPAVAPERITPRWCARCARGTRRPSSCCTPITRAN